MNLTKYIPENVTRAVGRSILHSQKHSPTILFAAGVVGVVTSTVMACRATLALDKELDSIQQEIKGVKDMPATTEQGELAHTQDLAYVYGKSLARIVKIYGPSIVIGGLAIGCLVRSNDILTKRNAALTAAYVALEKGFNNYRARVVRELGPEKDQEFRYGVEYHEVITEGPHGHEVVMHKRPVQGRPSIYARFFDEYSKNWHRDPAMNRVFLACQQDYANDRLRSRGHIFLNEVYDMLGLERTKEGAVVGWFYEKDGAGDNYVSFGIAEVDNPAMRDFINGFERSVLLDFNVDGIIYDKI